MWILVWIVAVVVVAMLWLMFGASDLCPTCGLRLVDSELDRLEEQVFGRGKHCPHCGAPV